MKHEEHPPIVGIEASAGSVQALQTFFDRMPDDTGAAFVVIVHLSPGNTSDLGNILARCTRMPVKQVAGQARLESNHVYVIAPNRRVKIADGMIGTLEFDEPQAHRTPVDFFLRSLAEQDGSAFAVILTAAGSDAAIGVRAIKEAGGIVLVQDPDEAEYASMPYNAIAAEAADFVLPIREIPDRLSALIASRAAAASAPGRSGDEGYRSTGEEPETSEEELPNNELKLKLESPSRAHSDLQNLMAATDVAMLFLNQSLQIKRFTPRLMEIFNVTPNDEGRPITDFTHQLDCPNFVDDARTVLKGLAPVEHEIESRNGRWYLVRMRPYRTIDHKIDGVVATFVDVTDRRRAEEIARESKQRLDQEMRLVELSRSPIFVWDFDDGIQQWNRGSEELYGYSRDEALGKQKEKLLKTVVPGSSFEALRQTLLEKGYWSGELRHTTKDGQVLTVESHIELQPLGDRRLVLEGTRDVTELKRWEHRRQLLLSELSHRVKNTLAVVQSLARQTLRTAHSSEDFVELLNGRLTALANAHKLLVESEWRGAELGMLAFSQLEAYIGGDRQRLRIEGESVMLPPDIATPFGLVLHELATNAAKYGALAVANGQVALSWKLGSEGRRLSVTWREIGGPPVKPPEEQGFGGVLIEKSLPGATVRRDFRLDGIVCTIDIELPDAA
ncbi:Chemotaxis protein methyltransferase CheR (plasmid) [Sinorhizobium sojae CCBAU 05684]|uniref:Blue-light-activated histidine kinase n=1 Tax=Sinorhizobium sojae CCBAU 05684 TaxID=716928 RepID=A0A249PL19_9HYPH|nr:chemotaxis protein CheB [Sinorhizobium sojae]ASY66611.1 Chemotaxis protein methyltransferase CheR [Sinorhizobium sojae CCBAU 05684]